MNAAAAGISTHVSSLKKTVSRTYIYVFLCIYYEVRRGEIAGALYILYHKLYFYDFSIVLQENY